MFCLHLAIMGAAEHVSHGQHAGCQAALLRGCAPAQRSSQGCRAFGSKGAVEPIGPPPVDAAAAAPPEITGVHVLGCQGT